MDSSQNHVLHLGNFAYNFTESFENRAKSRCFHLKQTQNDSYMIKDLFFWNSKATNMLY